MLRRLGPPAQLPRLPSGPSAACRLLPTARLTTGLWQVLGHVPDEHFERSPLGPGLSLEAEEGAACDIAPLGGKTHVAITPSGGTTGMGSTALEATLTGPAP